jgi:flagellar basal body rod protein FlgB
MLPVGDSTVQTIEYALRALEQRAEVTSQNVSNAEVPGYRANRLDFEGQLRFALEHGSLERLRGPQLSQANTPADASGNTVSVEDEMVEMLKTNLLQGAMVEAFNFKTGLMRSAIRGQ